MPKLKAISGEHKDREYPIGDKPILIGRRDSCEIVVKHNKASRSHAEVGVKNGVAYVKDLNSSNGTYINSIKISGEEERKVMPGDEIRVGDTVLRYFGTDAEIPDVEIPGHKLIEVIAEGGMGTIYRGLQTSMEREVAVKILNPEYSNRKEIVTHFIQEARSAGKLNHPNIVQVHTVGKSGEDCYYFTMELVKGENLAQLMSDREALTQEKIVDAAAKVADALEYAHERGVIHRDVKPENIVISDGGEVKLADLGIAQLVDVEDENESRQVLGTPHYMSPEQAEGKPVDGRSDLYSLGATLYCLLSGKPVFDASKSGEVMAMHVKDEHKPLKDVASDVDGAVCEIVEKLLAKNPAERYQRAAEVRDALEEAHKAVLAGGSKKRPTGPKPAVKKPTGSAGPVKQRTRPTRVKQQKSGNDMLVKAGVFVGVLVVAALASLVMFSGGEEKKVDTGPSAAEELESARQMARNGQLQEALDKYLKVKTVFADKPNIVETANRYAERLKKKIDENAREQEVELAWTKFEEELSRNKKRFSVVKSLLENLKKDYPELARKGEAAVETLAGESHTEFLAMRRKAENLALSDNFDQALSTVRRFNRSNPGHPDSRDIRTLERKIRSDAEKRYGDWEKRVKKAMSDERFGLALNECEEFRKKVKYSSVSSRVSRQERAIQLKINYLKNSMMREIRKHIAAFEYEQAMNEITKHRLALSGTQYEKDVAEQEKTISGLSKLHKKVMSAIGTSSPWELPENFGFDGGDAKKKASLVGVSKDGLVVAQGQFTTSVKWGKLTAAQLRAIYTHYVQATDKESQEALKNFSKMFR